MPQPKRYAKLPKTPEFLDKSELLRPSLSMLIHADTELNTREAKARAVKNIPRHMCEDCFAWIVEEPKSFCALGSCSCVNSILRPRFLPKEQR